MVDGRGNKRSISSGTDEVFIPLGQGEELKKKTPKRSVAMQPKHTYPLCDELCHDDEKEQVDASKPRPRPLRPHRGEELRGARTNRQRHRDLARPLTYQNTAPRSKSHTLAVTDQGQQGRKTDGMIPKAAIED